MCCDEHLEADGDSDMVEALKSRIEELRLENDGLNRSLTALAEQREATMRQALTNNGRILELERLLKEMQ